jgi:hypothetical protein
MTPAGLRRVRSCASAPRSCPRRRYAEPGGDPVGDDQQERLVARAGVLEPEARDDQPEDPEHHGDDGPRLAQRQLQAQGHERHRAGVDVQHVRGHGAEADRQQRGLAEEARHQGREGRRVDVGLAGGDDRRAGDLQQAAGQEAADPREQRDREPARVPGQVAGVVGGVRVPAGRVAERRSGGDQEPADRRRPVHRRGRRVRVRQHDDRADHEDDGEHRERVPLERVHEVVPEEGDGQLSRDDDDQREEPGETGQGGQRQGPADAVDREPPDAGGQRVEPGREDVAAVAEGRPAEDHLREPVARAPGGQRAERDRPEQGAEHDGGDRLPEGQPEGQDAQDADGDRRELEVRRRPRPQQLEGPAVALTLGDRLDPARLDGHHLRAVRELGLRDVGTGERHGPHSPGPTSPRATGRRLRNVKPAHGPGPRRRTPGAVAPPSPRTRRGGTRRRGRRRRRRARSRGSRAGRRRTPSAPAR